MSWKKSTGIHNNASLEAKGANCNSKHLSNYKRVPSKSVPEIIDKHIRNKKSKVRFFFHRLICNSPSVVQQLYLEWCAGT